MHVYVMLWLSYNRRISWKYFATIFMIDLSCIFVIYIRINYLYQISGKNYWYHINRLKKIFRVSEIFWLEHGSEIHLQFHSIDMKYIGIILLIMLKNVNKNCRNNRNISIFTSINYHSEFTRPPFLFFQHNHQYDTLLPIVPCTHKLSKSWNCLLVGCNYLKNTTRTSYWYPYQSLETWRCGTATWRRRLFIQSDS
jgi:hypothetical protein